MVCIVPSWPALPSSIPGCCGQAIIKISAETYILNDGRYPEMPIEEYPEIIVPTYPSTNFYTTTGSVIIPPSADTFIETFTNTVLYFTITYTNSAGNPIVRHITLNTNPGYYEEWTGGSTPQTDISISWNPTGF